MEKPYKSHGVMGTMLSEVVQCIGIQEVSRDLVRFVFNRTEGKLEVEVLKESESIRMVSKPFAQIYSIAIGQLR
jgi:PBP1b-binding outer membrane lipoprotein LpoB